MPSSTLPMLAIAAVLGTLCASPLPLDLRVLAALGALALGIFLVATRKPAQIRSLVVVTLVLAACNYAIRERLLPRAEATHTQRFSGVVSSERETSEDGRVAYTIDLDGGIRVLATSSRGADIGDRVIVRGRIEPFDDARNPGEPSERAMQRARGIDARLSGAMILSKRQYTTSSPRITLARLHAWALEQLRSYAGEPNAGILAGELWGERDDLPPDLRMEFQETGTVHILVTAGLHVGLVAGLIVAIGVALTIPRSYTCAIAVAGVWCFALGSGADVPAVRAATMASAMLAARALGAATASWNSLALAAIVVAFTLPFSVANASFALSFACVGAIFATSPLLERLFDRVSIPHRVREAMILTIATQLGTWPVTAAVFLQFSPYAVVANVAVVPLVPVTMVLGAIQLALRWCAPLAQACANVNAWALAWMLGVVRLLASLPIATIPMTPAPNAFIAAYEAALLALVPLARREATTLAIALAAFAGSCVLWPPSLPERRLIVTILDVGQADSIVIRMPSGHAILVDGGGRLERASLGSQSVAELVGERTVVPFLLRQGIHTLDALIVSHPHGDHVGGCRAVLRKIYVAEVADGGQTYGGQAYHNCLDTAAVNHVPIVHPRAGMVWHTNDGLTLTFIGPALPFIAGRNAINDNSVAFILQYKQFRMLFTGDAGVAAERRFLSEGLDLRADVLKVGHHGSAYSSSAEFVWAVHPQYAIISVGRHNLYGHPAPSTIGALKHFGAVVFRTDERGAITVTTNGSDSPILTSAIPHAATFVWR